MARNKGLAAFSANFEPQVAEPLDARGRVELKTDLIDPAVWEAADGGIYAYVGMSVVVYNDGDNNGIYYLKSADYTVAENWEKAGTGDGQNIDGGGASSVYLVEQNIDGGNA